MGLFRGAQGITGPLLWALVQRQRSCFRTLHRPGSLLDEAVACAHGGHCSTDLPGVFSRDRVLFFCIKESPGPPPAVTLGPTRNPRETLIQRSVLKDLPSRLCTETLYWGSVNFTHTDCAPGSAPIPEMAYSARSSGLLTSAGDPPPPPCGDTWLCQVMIAIKEIAQAPTCTAKEKRSRLITDRSDRP
jgi:hypothetical protein